MDLDILMRVLTWKHTRNHSAHRTWEGAAGTRRGTGGGNTARAGPNGTREYANFKNIRNLCWWILYLKLEIYVGGYYILLHFMKCYEIPVNLCWGILYFITLCKIVWDFC